MIHTARPNDFQPGSFIMLPHVTAGDEPVFNEIFYTRPLAPDAWLRIGLIGLAAFALVEGEKKLSRRLESH